jgi:hypothetical protein
MSPRLSPLVVTALLAACAADLERGPSPSGVDPGKADAFGPACDPDADDCEDRGPGIAVIFANPEALAALGLVVERETDAGFAAYRFAGRLEDDARLNLRVYPDLCQGDPFGGHDLYTQPLAAGAGAEEAAARLKGLIVANNPSAGGTNIAEYDVRITADADDPDAVRVEFGYCGASPDPEPEPEPEPEGQFCGGFANLRCPAGQTCVLDGDHPDAGGHCE